MMIPRRRTVACAIVFGFLSLLRADPRAAGAQDSGQSPGDLDTTFSGDGHVSTDIGGYDYGTDVAIHADGKIVVVGSTYFGGGNDFALARYHPDGSLDATFSADGMQTTDFGGMDHAWAVAIQSDGKIVVAGSSGIDFALARYDADGSLDPTFSDDGKLTTDFGGGRDDAYDVALQSNGKIVVVGVAGADFALVRYNVDGSLDTSFPGAGKQVTDFGGFDYARAIAIQEDGKIVVAGVTDAPAPTCDWCAPPNFALARYNVDGNLDRSFSGDGKEITDFGGDDYAADVALQADGKIVVVGSNYVYHASSTTFALARFNPDGLPDVTFGREGRMITLFTNLDMASSVALQPDGKILVLGFVGEGPALVRYDPDGRLDVTFSSDGLQMIGGIQEPFRFALQADGKIVAVGSANGGTDLNFGLARYHGGSVATDLTPPETTITGGPTYTTTDNTPTFTFDSNESGSTFACRVDDSAFFQCSSPHTTSTLNEGPHVFEVRATDAAGNADTTPASVTFVIEKASATVSLSNLTQTYTGTARTPTATTIPQGLAIVWTNAPQTNPGNYVVTATVNDPNYRGAASGTFVINPPASALSVTVQSPNGGERLLKGASFTIQWTATGNAVPNPLSFDVALSLNAGNTFTNITGCTNLNGALRSCIWRPATTSSDGRIRVTARDAGGVKVADMSNASFVIRRSEY